ncbi:Vegetative incompatibility protein HET-E-1, partial [Tolypocladium ophioglossoides CBS 100239]
MGGKRLRNWVKGLGTNFIESRDAVPSTQSLSLPTGSEQRDLQHGTEPSGRTSEPHASTAEPVGDDQAAPAGTDAGVQAARPPAAAQRAPPPDLAIEPRAEASPATQLPQRQTHSISTSQRLWNAAYDRLKDDKDTAELVTAYVKTLMKVLGASLETTFGADVMTELEDPVRRQLVMKKLVEEGRSKADKASKIAKRVGDFAQAVLSFKPLVDLVLSIPQAAPAALPWAGVCIGLQILSNPAAAAKSNLAGITHVLSRMEWYDAVTEHLLNEDGLEIRDGTFQAVLRQLEEKVVALYKALLLYQMKSICSYYRHQGYVFLRALANWDDWDAHLKTITDAEDTLRRDSSQYNKQHASSALGELVGRAEGTQNLLGNIRQDIRELIALQKKAQSDKDTKCLQALFVVNPQDHMARIEDEKDKLLYEVYEWMLHTESYAAFTSWDQPDLPLCRLLWIKGTAGTGKTMLMMGIIRELLDQSAALAPSLSYFFCQGTGTKKLNSATAALKSLLWMLLIQQPHLISYLQDDYKYSCGFADETEFYTLQRIFEDILRDPSLSEAYLIVDALDEFDRTKPGLEELIRLVSTSLVLSKKVKWLLSSRPEVDLLARVTDRNADTLDTSETLVELDTERLEKPVHAYIGHKLSTLKGKRGYDDSILGEVETEVRQRAMNTFLWVALAFKVLEKAHGQQAVQRIQKIPPGLSELYGHMMDRIDQVEEISPQDCKKVLLCAGLAFRPLAFAELAILADMPVDITETAVELCGSFLATREKTVFLIHQSAKEYLAQKWLQVTEIAQGHANIGRRSIEAMSSALKRNIYGLDYGLKPMGMKAPQPDPLAPIQYACVFWADHLAFESGKSPECQESLADDGEVLLFLEEYILHWLESLSLLGNLSEGIQSVKRLLQIAQISGTSRRLAKFLEDADKFIRSHGSIMERAPMQIYCSALAFSPTTS